MLARGLTKMAYRRSGITPCPEESEKTVARASYKGQADSLLITGFILARRQYQKTHNKIRTPSHVATTST